ncbi:hypothetical protein HAX54_026696, partial [Datura stramonium]|nr:hypothetical protein [Datura stramonium]
MVQVQDGPDAPGKRIEEASNYFMHAPLGILIPGAEVMGEVTARHTSSIGADGHQLDNVPSLESSRSGPFSSSATEMVMDRQASDGSSQQLSPRQRFPGPLFKVDRVDDGLSKQRPITLSFTWEKLDFQNTIVESRAFLSSRNWGSSSVVEVQVILRDFF